MSVDLRALARSVDGYVERRAAELATLIATLESNPLFRRSRYVRRLRDEELDRMRAELDRLTHARIPRALSK